MRGSAPLTDCHAVWEASQRFEQTICGLQALCPVVHCSPSDCAGPSAKHLCNSMWHLWYARVLHSFTSLVQQGGRVLGHLSKSTCVLQLLTLVQKLAKRPSAPTCIRSQHGMSHACSDAQQSAQGEDLLDKINWHLTHI